MNTDRVLTHLLAIAGERMAAQGCTVDNQSIKLLPYTADGYRVASKELLDDGKPKMFVTFQNGWTNFLIP